MTDSVETPKVNTRERNKQVAALPTLADCYKFFYDENLNKLSEWQKKRYLENLVKQPEVIRGEIVEFDNVRKFIQLVIRESEEAWDKRPQNISK